MSDRLFMGLCIAVLCAALGCEDDSAAGADGGSTTLDGGSGDVSLDGLFSDVGGGDDASVLDVGVEGDSGAPAEDTSGGGETVGRFESCGLTGPQCEEPMICVGNCQLPCSAESPCPDPEVCIEVGGGFGACGTVSGEGDPCDITVATVCDDGLFCDEGTCRAPEEQGEGEECGGTGNTCEDGLTCITTGFGQGRCHTECEGACASDAETCAVPVGSDQGACFAACDPDGEDDCPDGYECREQIGGGEVACFPAFGGGGGGGGDGELGFGEPCSGGGGFGGGGGPGGGGGDCAGDLFCPQLPGGYCTASCEESTDCPEDPPGATCENFVAFTACAFTCPDGVGDCPEGMACDDVFGVALCHW